MTEPVPPLRTILVGTDLTEGAQLAARAAWALRPPGAKGHVVHCLEGRHREASAGGDDTEDPSDLLRHHLADAGIPADELELHLREGAPHREIPRFAEDLQADLVALGPHEPRRAFDGLLGSTADRLLRLTHAPCLVVNREVQAPPGRILVASDLSGVSQRALAFALAWATEWAGRAEGGSVHVEVLHVFDFTRPGYSPPGDQRTRLQRQVDEAKTWPGDGVTVRPRTLSAPLAPEGIERVATEGSPDLLFMGTHGHGFFMRTLLGSVASEVVRTIRLPVVVVPPPPGED